MRTKLTLLAVGLAATIAAAPAQAALDEGGGAAVTPVVSLAAEGSTASARAHSTARSDAVIAWNANAGKAAVAACISPVDNPLHESRLYAMTHVAIHDALNAIDRRSRPYAFSARVKRRASPEAAVAAAARDVLVPLLNQIPAPFPPACGAAGAASVEADYAAALAAIPDGRAKTRGIEVGEAAAAAILALRAADGADTPLVVTDYPQGTNPGEYRFTPGTPFVFAPGWADVTPFVLARQLTVPSRSARRGDVEEVHRRLRRDQASRRRRHHHAERAQRRADRDRPLLGRELPAAVESNRADRLRQPAARSVGAGAAVRPAQHGARRRLRRLLRHQVPLQLLAPGDRDPDRRHRRQPEHQRRPDVDAAGDDSSDPGLRLGAQRRRRSSRRRSSSASSAPTASASEPAA